MITSSRNLILLCLVATLTLGNRFFVNAKKLDHDSLIRVYDNVMPPNTAEWLHHACLQLGQGVSVFQYPLENPSRHTSIEQFLDLLLKELYPSEKYYVEYWKRSEWHHILAHADMDEGWEKQTAQSPSTPLKHPETGHVLYLQVGKHVRGPTVVWNVTRGADFTSGNVYEMISVPAFPGRLLQFRGNALHAVPRPSDVYWTHQEDGDAPYDASLDLRSVLLFNTWPIDQGMLVGQDIQNQTKTSDPAPISLYPNPVTEWSEVNVVNYEENSNMSWLDAMFRLLTSSYYETFWIPLMGNVRRRGMVNTIAKLEGHHGVREAFRDPHRVTRMTIQTPKQRVLGIEL